MKSLFEQNGGTYRQVEDHLIPNLTLLPEAKKPIGVWGQRHKDYLREDNAVEFYIMLTNALFGLILLILIIKRERCLIRSYHR